MDQYKNKKVISYCTIGARSSKYSKQLLSISSVKWDAYNLSGGILAWTHSNNKLMDSKGLATKVFTVPGRQWDLGAKNFTPHFLK